MKDPFLNSGCVGYFHLFLSYIVPQQMLASFKAASVRLDLLAGSGVTCVVVEGPQGSGKTSLLRWLAAHHGRTPRNDLLYLHLGEQIDGKVRRGQGSQRVLSTWSMFHINYLGVVYLE